MDIELYAAVTGNVATETSVAGQKSQEAAKILSGTSGSNSTSTDSERTYRVDSQDSQISDTETTGDRHWPRQNSVTCPIQFLLPILNDSFAIQFGFFWDLESCLVFFKTLSIKFHIGNGQWDDPQELDKNLKRNL